MAVDLNHIAERTLNQMKVTLGNYIKPEACADMVDDRRDEVRVRTDGITEVHTKAGWLPADEQGIKAWAHQVAAGAGTSVRLPNAGMSEEEMQALMRRQRQIVGY